MPLFEVGALSLAEAGGAGIAEAAFSDIAAQQAAAAAMSGAGIGSLGGLAGLGTTGLGAPAGYEAFLEQLTSMNPEIVAQNQAISQAASVPMSGPTVAPAAPPTPQGIGGLPAGSNFAQPIPAQYQSAMGQLAQGAGQYPASQLASLNNAGVADALNQNITQNIGLGEGQGEDFLQNTGAPVSGQATPAGPAATPGAPATPKTPYYPSEFAESAAKYPDLYPGKLTSGGSTVFYPSGEAKFSFGNAPDTAAMIQARGATAPAISPISSAAPSAAQTAANLASMPSPTATDIAQMADIGPAKAAKPSFFDKIMNDPVYKYGSMGLGALQALKYLGKTPGLEGMPGYDGGPLAKFRYSPSTYTPYTYKPYAAGGPVETMSNENAIGANTGYPQADIQHGAYATPWQSPISRNVVADVSDAGVDQMTGMERMAGGGIASLGSYSDGGRLLKGPGDGMSDGIPATIGRKQPARLADGEFVVPADVVSGLGNGSTDAGAKHLYNMMDKVRSARTGTKKQGRQINPNKYLPA